MADVQIDRTATESSVADFVVVGSVMGAMPGKRSEDSIANPNPSDADLAPNHFDEIRNRAFGPRLANDPAEKDWRTKTTAERVAHDANLLSFGSALAEPAFNAKRIADLVGHLEKDQVPPFIEFLKQQKGFGVKTDSDGTVNISYVRDYRNYDESAPWYIKTLFFPDIIARNSFDYLGRTFGGADCSISIKNSQVVVESNNLQVSNLLKGQKPFVRVEVPRNPK